MKSIQKNFLLLIILAITLLTSCGKEKKLNLNTDYYQAFYGRDTANLSITMNKSSFEGQYEIIYGKKTMKDSGYVSGEINGDTLMGQYTFLSYGGSWVRNPITFLKKDGKLFLGSGLMCGNHGFVSFDVDVPIEYDSAKFVFKKLTAK